MVDPVCQPFYDRSRATGVTESLAAGSVTLSREHIVCEPLSPFPSITSRSTPQSVLDQVTKYKVDVLVIDDGSTDETPRILAARKDIQVLTHHPNQGYGKSLRDAFAYADAHGYDWVITMDCDEQHEPSRIPDFLREIATDRWDIISGSRYLAQDAGDDLPPADRRSINAKLTAPVERPVRPEPHRRLLRLQGPSYRPRR